MNGPELLEHAADLVSRRRREYGEPVDVFEAGRAALVAGLRHQGQPGAGRDRADRLSNWPGSRAIQSISTARSTSLATRLACGRSRDERPPRRAEHPRQAEQGARPRVRGGAGERSGRPDRRAPPDRRHARKMLQVGRHDHPAMHDAARDFQADFTSPIWTRSGPRRSLRVPGTGREPELNERQLDARAAGARGDCRRWAGSTARPAAASGMSLAAAERPRVGDPAGLEWAAGAAGAGAGDSDRGAGDAGKLPWRRGTEGMA